MTQLPSITNLLMSPPETILPDDFSITPMKSPSASRYRSSDPETARPKSPRSDDNIRILPSPPISPWMDKRQRAGTMERGVDLGAHRQHYDTTDPVLFPENGPDDHAERPLFQDLSQKPIRNTEELITKHMAMHMIQYKGKLTRPSRDEYRLALACVPTIGAQYNRNPGAYMKRQREESDNEYWQAKRICARPGTKAGPIAIAPSPKSHKRAIKPISPKAGPPRLKRVPKLSPLAKLMNYPPKGRSETPDRMPGIKREDVDYASIPDYTPPTSTLAHHPRSLKADWPSNNILNLTHDPDRHMLHEAEVNVAATLRLTCATYLCSKRRIFEARLNALRIGKEFRKTDAQQACKIDVNKASKLWTAFDRVGWFDQKYVLPHL